MTVKTGNVCACQLDEYDDDDDIWGREKRGTAKSAVYIGT